jgi:hypothetical protein
VRYFGLWHPANREHGARTRLLLVLNQPAAPASPGACEAEPNGDLPPVRPDQRSRPPARIVRSAIAC